MPTAMPSMSASIGAVLVNATKAVESRSSAMLTPAALIATTSGAIAPRRLRKKPRSTTSATMSPSPSTQLIRGGTLP